MVVLLLLGGMTAPVAEAPLEVATEGVTVTTLVMVVGMQVEMVITLKIGAGEDAAAGAETPAADEAAAGLLTTAVTGAAAAEAVGMVCWAAALLSEAATGQKVV